MGQDGPVLEPGSSILGMFLLIWNFFDKSIEDCLLAQCCPLGHVQYRQVHDLKCQFFENGTAVPGFRVISTSRPILQKGILSQHGIRGGHLDIGKSGIRFPFFCWNLFVLDIAGILFISIASPRYISCRNYYF